MWRGAMAAGASAALALLLLAVCALVTPNVLVAAQETPTLPITVALYGESVGPTLEVGKIKTQIEDNTYFTFATVQVINNVEEVDSVAELQALGVDVFAFFPPAISSQLNLSCVTTTFLTALGDYAAAGGNVVVGSNLQFLLTTPALRAAAQPWLPVQLDNTLGICSDVSSLDPALHYRIFVPKTHPFSLKFPIAPFTVGSQLAWAPLGLQADGGLRSNTTVVAEYVVEASRQTQTIGIGPDEKGCDATTQPDNAFGGSFVSWNQSTTPELQAGIALSYNNAGRIMWLGQFYLSSPIIGGNAMRVGEADRMLENALYWASGAVPDCSAACVNGTCQGPPGSETCVCDGNWRGPACDEYFCDPGYCQNGARCVGPNVCACDQAEIVGQPTPQSLGYVGPRCATPFCQPTCSNGGTCIQPIPSLCDCSNATGWEGDLCNIPICDVVNCTGGQGFCSQPNNCTCTDPTTFAGPECKDPVCEPPCQNNGTCVAPGICACVNASGTRCQNPVCPSPCYRGTCAFGVGPGGTNACDCPAPQSSYVGERCLPLCNNSLTGCRNGGVCLDPDTCDCSPGTSPGRYFAGTFCETEVLTTGTTGTTGTTSPTTGTTGTTGLILPPTYTQTGNSGNSGGSGNSSGTGGSNPAPGSPPPPPGLIAPGDAVPGLPWDTLVWIATGIVACLCCCGVFCCMNLLGGGNSNKGNNYGGWVSDSYS